MRATGSLTRPQSMSSTNGRGIDTDQVADRLGCSPQLARRALQYAGESLAEMFWEDAEATARDIFGDKSLKVYSEGRSGGWLVVEGLPDIEYWDAIMLGKWRSLEVRLQNEVKYIGEFDYVIDRIEANEWHVELTSELEMVADRLAALLDGTE